MGVSLGQSEKGGGVPKPIARESLRTQHRIAERDRERRIVCTQEMATMGGLEFDLAQRRKAPEGIAFEEIGPPLKAFAAGQYFLGQMRRYIGYATELINTLVFHRSLLLRLSTIKKL
jgi:hypothetical protein